MLKKSLISLSLLILLFSSCSKHNDVQPATNAKACFTAPTTANASVPVTFNSSCSLNAITYHWDFGDGATSTDSGPAHAYSKAGTFTVKLTVTAANKSTSDFSATITISKLPVVYHMSDITADETWQAGYIHYVLGTVNVHNATVTVQPGVTVLFQSGSWLNIGPDSYKSTKANLIANGTATAPIVFTADSQTPTAGYYNGITFGKGSNGLSSLAHCTVEYGGYAYASSPSYNGNIKITNTVVSIENCTIRHNKGSGVFTSDSSFFAKFNNNTFTDYEAYALEMSPNTPHSIGTGNSFGAKPFVIDGGQFKLPSATWPALGFDYILSGTVTVAASDTTTISALTIAPGVTIRASGASGFKIGNATAYTGPTFKHKGSLIAVGTATSPITFTSSSTTPAPADWGGILFYIGNKNSSLKYCNIQYGGSNIGYNTDYPGMVTVAAPSNVSISNCTFSNAKTCAFFVSLTYGGTFQSFDYNTITQGTADDGVYIPANFVNNFGANNTITARRELTVGGSFTKANATWPKFSWPYYIDGIIGISSQSASGAFLTLTAGSEFRMLTPNSGFIVGDDLPTSSFKGGLAAVGTAAAPIKFTSAKSPAAPGDWYTIQFGGTSLSGSKLQYAIVEYGGSTLGNVYIERTTVPTVTYCTITNSMTYGVITNSCTPTVSNITYSGNTSGNTYSGSW